MIVNGEPLSFLEFPKISRLSRETIITEKIDGTNAQIIISDDGQEIAAGSRKKLITQDNDNFGFARWVNDNKDELLKLGPGRHFGEWWGKGIQRGYGINERRFSLFNTSRWTSAANSDGDESTRCFEVQCCHVVPVLKICSVFNTDEVDWQLEQLRHLGSYAAPGFMNPEGIVVFHSHSNTMFKKTLDNDDAHKGTA